MATNALVLGRRAEADALSRDASLDQLVLEHLPSALRFATRLTGDPHAAEELVQEALVRVVRRFATFRGEATFRTWLFRIVINVFRDRLAATRSAAVSLHEQPEEPIDKASAGPAEAALGVCLRVAWRALVLAGRPADEILFTLSQLLGHERQDDTMFATMCMVSVAPDRSVGWVRMAGHLPPLLVTRSGVRELPTLSAPPLGLGDVRDWPGTHVRLEGSWSILLYTDGLIEGRIGRGSERLGSEGLMDLIRNIQQGQFPGTADGHQSADDQLLDEVIDRVRQLNGRELDDDLAILALGFSSPDGR